MESQGEFDKGYEVTLIIHPTEFRRIYNQWRYSAAFKAGALYKIHEIIIISQTQVISRQNLFYRYFKCRVTVPLITNVCKYCLETAFYLVSIFGILIQ